MQLIIKQIKSKMKRINLIVLFALMISVMFSQVAISTDGSAPDATAILDLATTEKGFLIPRLSITQIEAINNPADGLQVYCTTNGKLYIFVASLGQWKELAYASSILLPPFNCGMPLTINHIAGDVAPVTKTVTYITVSNIPGEISKCWITSNLGADHQAYSVNDTTEASSGWYWQFNRMQGYKHTGITITPSWPITLINEDSEWLADNDPCVLEIGIGWRIPTITEWININAGGNWIDWNGPWNSALKIHAAGDIIPWVGSLENRGLKICPWSSTHTMGGSDYYGLGPVWEFDWSESSSVWNQATGLTIRCLKD